MPVQVAVKLFRKDMLLACKVTCRVSPDLLTLVVTHTHFCMAPLLEEAIVAVWFTIYTLFMPLDVLL